MDCFQAGGTDAHFLAVNSDVLKIDCLSSFGGDV